MAELELVVVYSELGEYEAAFYLDTLNYFAGFLALFDIK